MGKHILVVDDEESIVTLLTFNLERAGFVVDQAYDGLTAINKTKKHCYDLIILDLMLPQMDGMEVCRKLRESQIETPIFMLTARDDETELIKGLELGADDYLTKPFSPKEVIARVNAILRRTTKRARGGQQFLKIGHLIIHPDRYEVEKRDQTLSFTRKEFELLLYLATHSGLILSREQLLKEVWDYDFIGDTRIVDVHISRLRDKIEDDTKKPVYIKTIRGLGYKMEEVLE